MKRKRRIDAVLLFLFCSLAFAGFLSSHAAAEKVRTAIPQANLNYLSIYVTEAKGFFRAESIEHKTVVIVGPTATAALLSGDVDYSGAGGSGMRAATKGAPIKAIMFQTERVTFYLVTEPTK
ncbi:MAG: ABC transporter substrate-binding protein [Deltaproteobacteria bacterium]|nr:ABC transporter substrate-binding protein [Deltaproteobacteria bacterium]